MKRFLVILLFAAVSSVMLYMTFHREYDIETEDISMPVISEYDSIMQTVETESGIDWRLLSAIAYTESKFHGHLVSRRGAVGVMQVMPSIGRYFGISTEELSKPHNNIRAAAFLLCDIESTLRLPEGLAEKDRLGILLACYNAGIGHVNDARRLARAFGESMNSWNSVSHYLRLKSDPEYYEHEVVKYGKFEGGRSTTAYVRNVLKRYEHYCKITDKAQKSILTDEQ